MKIGLSACVVLVSWGCGSNTEPPPTTGSGSDVAKPTPPPPVAVDAAPAASGPTREQELAAWMPKDAKAALEGAWMTKLAMRDTRKLSSYTGTYAALEISGDHAKAWGAANQADHDLGFAITSPCQFQLTEKDSDGGTNYFRKVYALDGGKLYVGGGAAGYRKGKTAFVCMNDDVYILDDKGVCRRWKDHFGTWEVEPTTCTWSKGRPSWVANDAGWAEEHLVIDKPDMANELAVRGDLLVNIHFRDALEGKDLVKQADFAAAKAAATKRFVETDPLERVKTAGGKVGSLATILDVAATYYDDKANVKGKPVSVAARFDHVKTETDNGKTTYRVTAFDPADKAKSWEFNCTSTKPVSGFKAGDKVHLKGTGAEYWDSAALTDCVVTR